MKTSIVSRFWFKNSISDVRLKLIQNFYIKSLQEQDDKDFAVFLLVHPDTVDVVKKLNWGNLKVNFIEVIKNDPPDAVPTAVPSFDKFIPKTNIQIRIDTDDWVKPYFLTKCKALIRGYDDALVTFQPTKHDLSTDNFFLHNKIYSGNCPSMFTMIYQKNPRITIFNDHHGNMGKYFNNKIYVCEYGLCNLVIHSENLLSKI